MPTKTIFTTKEALVHTPLPQHGGRYTVIPHEFIINKAKDQLTDQGFVIKHELYKSTMNAEVAQGMYHLENSADPDMGMMFAWTNSYDKSRRFKCAIGAHVFVCINGVISGDMASFSRKHTGDADQEASDMIAFQISKAGVYFNQLVEDKDLLSNKLITTKTQAEIVGRLFLEERAVTLTQLGIIEREIKNPSYDYDTDPDSAWSLYNHVTHSLKESHPSIYLENHQRVHKIFMDVFKPNKTTFVAPIEPEFDFSAPEPVLEPATPSRNRVVFV